MAKFREEPTTFNFKRALNQSPFEQRWLTELKFGKVQNAPEQKSIKLTLDTKTLLLKPVGLTALQWKNKCKREHPMYSDSQITAYVDAKIEEDQ